MGKKFKKSYENRLANGGSLMYHRYIKNKTGGVELARKSGLVGEAEKKKGVVQNGDFVQQTLCQRHSETETANSSVISQ